MDISPLVDKKLETSNTMYDIVSSSFKGGFTYAAIMMKNTIKLLA